VGSEVKSPTTGYTVLPVDQAKLGELLAATQGRVAYRLNAKPKAGQDPATIKKADCSGFLHWLIPQIVTEHCDFPDGSWVQREWCKHQGFKSTEYKNSALHDHRLRIAFITPVGSKPGHVWLTLDRLTIECHSGEGVDRRPWNKSVLFTKVSACYVLTDPLG
jgi:hypothetical protein